MARASPLDIRGLARLLISLCAENCRLRSIGIVAANLRSRRWERNPLARRRGLVLLPDVANLRWRQNELAAAGLALDRRVSRGHSHACEQCREDAVAVESRRPQKSVAFAVTIDFRTGARQA